MPTKKEGYPLCLCRWKYKNVKFGGRNCPNLTPGPPSPSWLVRLKAFLASFQVSYVFSAYFASPSWKLTYFWFTSLTKPKNLSIFGSVMSYSLFSRKLCLFFVTLIQNPGICQKHVKIVVGKTVKFLTFWKSVSVNQKVCHFAPCTCPVQLTGHSSRGLYKSVHVLEVSFKGGSKLSESRSFWGYFWWHIWHKKGAWLCRVYLQGGFLFVKRTSQTCWKFSFDVISSLYVFGQILLSNAVKKSTPKMGIFGLYTVHQCWCGFLPRIPYSDKLLRVFGFRNNFMHQNVWLYASWSQIYEKLSKFTQVEAKFTWK